MRPRQSTLASVDVSGPNNSRPGAAADVALALVEGRAKHHHPRPAPSSTPGDVWPSWLQTALAAGSAQPPGRAGRSPGRAQALSPPPRWLQATFNRLTGQYAGIRCWTGPASIVASV